MFLESSRYAGVGQTDAPLRDGRTVRAVKLRRLPPTGGEPTRVMGNDRLDVMAQRRYNDPTWFWHVADANTELEANTLVRTPNRMINVPPQ